MIEFIAKDISELSRAIVSITRRFIGSKPWWRGQRNAAWGLVPSLYRSEYNPKKEININARFRMMAKTRHTSCPSADDPFGWLFLMQHYRLPTRLLDWSESPLVGLYFAVEDKILNGTDSVLWALCPTVLNFHQLNKEAICTPRSQDIIQISREAFVLNQKTPDCRVISVLTEQSDIRHLVQQSVFTIHGCDTSITMLPEAKQYLAKIIIPAKAKEGFRQILSLFGISRSSLFPDLENLATELTSLSFAIDTEPVTPPENQGGAVVPD